MTTLDIAILPAQEALFVDGHTPQTITTSPETVDRGLRPVRQGQLSRRLP
jgi:hypothetical protein